MREIASSTSFYADALLMTCTKGGALRDPNRGAEPRLWWVMT
jgi:hypothetical protein